MGRIRNWVLTEALPLWSCAGFDAAQGSFVERLSFQGEPLTATPRRAMVQARQIYCLSHAALQGWWPQGRDMAVGAAHRFIENYFEADGAHGWAFSVYPDGKVCDGKRDFYAHASLCLA